MGGGNFTPRLIFSLVLLNRLEPTGMLKDCSYDFSTKWCQNFFHIAILESGYTSGKCQYFIEWLHFMHYVIYLFILKIYFKGILTCSGNLSSPLHSVIHSKEMCCTNVLSNCRHCSLSSAERQLLVPDRETREVFGSCRSSIPHQGK